MNFRTLVESHPEVIRDRYSLSFSNAARPADIAGAFSHRGVVMLKGVLAAPLLTTARQAFDRFVRSHPCGETNDAGSWYSP